MDGFYILRVIIISLHYMWPLLLAEHRVYCACNRQCSPHSVSKCLARKLASSLALSLPPPHGEIIRKAMITKYSVTNAQPICFVSFMLVATRVATIMNSTPPRISTDWKILPREMG